jgi:hypothetical protein
MTSPDGTPAPLPIYLVTWTLPRQRRDGQKAAAAVGTGSLLQLARTVLAELHTRTMVSELGEFLPQVRMATPDALEDVPLERTDSAWDRIDRVGSANYTLDHPSWPERLHLSVQVPFCPGCHGRGGAHAEGCWGSDRPALPLG